MDKIKPELAGGFRDYFPEDMIPRNAMLAKLKEIFERFGFVPMDTPALEREEVLVGDKTDFLIYRASTQEDESKLALRYDLTVPLARVVAANPELARPFKRYQFGRVWRGEKQQVGKGRFREFTQLDVDIVGSDTMQADAEIVALMYESMTALGLTEFVIKINNRKILERFSPEVLRSIDKLDKIGWEGVEKELGPDQITELKEFFGSPQTNADLDALIANALALGVPKDKLIIDNTVVRGLGYYTGNVFETVLVNVPEVGSVFSGGRYDGLVERFAPFSIPAVGASVGIDRLFGAMDQLGMIAPQKNTAKVFILNFDVQCQDTVQQTATKLRQAGIATELYLGQEDTLKGQLAYAVKQEYPIAIILGQDEKTKNTVQLKNMNAREQSEVPQDDLLSAIKAILR